MMDNDAIIYGKKPTAVIIDAFDNFDIRTKYVFEVLSEKYDTVIMTSNFSHSLKRKIEVNRESCVVIDTKPYAKNLSVKRIVSHSDFAKKVYKQLCEMKPDLIYCVVPPNSLVKRVAIYAKRNSVKVYFDIFDLWPESMPVSNGIKKLLFGWKNLRDKHLHCAEKVFLECDYYKRFLPKNINCETLYLCKEKRDIEYHYQDDELRFVYLGSINNIIDIDGIVRLLSAIREKRRICLYIIGGGESAQRFISQLTAANISVIDYGKIYDEDKKDEIIARCHFGINMYKKGLCIGLTMKSVDYFCRGLPIISGNIFDTAKFIDEFCAGYNIDDVDMSQTIDEIINIDEGSWVLLQKNSERVYDKYLSSDRIHDPIGLI